MISTTRFGVDSPFLLIPIMATDRSSNQPAQVQTTPENRVISPAVRKRLQRCFERGGQLAGQDKPDHDYAHTMFIECVVNDPGNLEYVEAMLDNLQRKYNNNKKGARLKGFGGRGAFKKAVSAEDWDQVFRLGMDLLKTNPWDVQTLRVLAEACKVNHLNEVELRYLKNALDVNSKDIEVNKHCAESLARMGQFDQAIACWHRVQELDKGNKEAKKKMADLTLAKTMGTPLPDSNTNTSQTKGKAAEETPEVASEVVAEDISEEATESTSEAMVEDFTDPEQFIQHAEQLTAEHRYRDAYQAYRKAMDIAGGRDLRIQEMLEDAQIRMIRAQVAIAEQRANSEQTTEANDLVRRFRAELNRQELLIYNARSERFPDDLSLRYELGIRLKRDGNFRQAIESFKAVRGDESRCTVATLEMGECFQHLKQYGNAMKCYQATVGDSQAQPEVLKLALYRAGVLAAALKDVDAARKFLQNLVEMDASYRDATLRLDKLA